MKPIRPNEEYRFRLESAKQPMIHIRKKCDCGKVVTARQLTQYGMCAKCYSESQEE